MQKYKQAAIAIAFLTIILSAGICNGFISRDEENESKREKSQKVAILNAFEQGDYDTWKKIITQKGGVFKNIDKEEFERFIAARQAARSGDYDTAINISAALENDLKLKLGEKYLS